MTKQYDYASFYPGQPFPYEQAETSSDYLETALAAERYIASRQLEDADGVYWQEDGQSAYDISLFKGPRASRSSTWNSIRRRASSGSRTSRAPPCCASAASGGMRPINP